MVIAGAHTRNTARVPAQAPPFPQCPRPSGVKAPLLTWQSRSGGVACAKHVWAIAPPHIEQFRIVLSIYKVSAPTIQHDFPSMPPTLHQTHFTLCTRAPRGLGPLPVASERICCSNRFERLMYPCTRAPLLAAHCRGCTGGLLGSEVHPPCCRFMASGLQGSLRGRPANSLHPNRK